MGLNDTQSAGGRAEMIKRARESCNQSMDTGRGGSNDENSRSISFPWSREKEDSFGRTDQTVSSKKFWIIRLVFAIVIFLFIVVMDQFDLEYSDFKSNDLQKYISSNEKIDKAEDFFSSLSKEKILDVFNRLN